MKYALLFVVFFLFPLVIPQSYRKVRVAIQKGLCTNGLELDNLVSNINADGRFTATQVDDTDIDSVAKLNKFDTVYIGGSANDVDINKLSTDAANAITTWVQLGGGLVTSSFVASWITSSSLTSPLQSVTPITFSTTTRYCRTTDNYAIDYTDFTHPVAQNVPSSYFFVNSYCVFSPAGIPSNARSIATIRDSTTCTGLNTVTSPQGVVVMEPGKGRTVYICTPFCALDFIYSSRNLWINDETKQTFLSALWWTAGIAPCPPDCDAGMSLVPSLIAAALALLFSLSF